MNDEIIELQTRLSFQDGLLEELNQALANQQKQIETLEYRLAVFQSQLESVQNNPMMRPGDEPPPPHY